MALCLLPALAGCVLPGDPVGPPGGVRVDDGVVSAVVRFCEGDEVVGVEAWDARRSEVVWSATGYVRPYDGVLVLAPDHWASASGATTLPVADLDVEVQLTDRTESAVVSAHATADDLEGLPVDSFNVRGEVRTLGEFQEIIERDYGCGDPRPDQSDG